MKRREKETLKNSEEHEVLKKNISLNESNRQNWEEERKRPKKLEMQRNPEKSRRYIKIFKELVEHKICVKCQHHRLRFKALLSDGFDSCIQFIAPFNFEWTSFEIAFKIIFLYRPFLTSVL